MKDSEIEQQNPWLHYLGLSFAAFICMALELLLVSIEPLLYGKAVTFSDWTVISHWILTCTLWSLSALFLLKSAIKRCGFNLREKVEHPNSISYLYRLIIIAVIFIFTVFISYQSWNGFKIVIEFKKLGLLKFCIQYFYYFIEAILFMLIIAFSQQAFELRLKYTKIPYGGIFCGLTWGLSHILTQASISDGLLTALSALFFGTVYILLNKNVLKSFPVIFLMFIL